MDAATLLPGFDNPATPPAWVAEEGSLRCVQVIQETHDVKTFVFAAPGRAATFRYLPGQFLTFEFMVNGHALKRCYTLSSTPTRPDRVSITVKRVPGGPISNWLHDHFLPGMQLEALGPGGVFSCFVPKNAGGPRYLFVSGGSGITPLMSMSRALHDLASEADVVFVHCARTPADVIFAEELALMARRMKRFWLAVICEQQPAGSAYAGHLGRIDRARLAQIAPDFADREIYTCGPAPFMAAVRGLLADTGFAMAKYREESFSFDALPPAVAFGAVDHTDLAPAAVQGAYTVTLAKSGRSFQCRPDQPILQAAGAAGVRLPSSCSSGLCGTCKTRKTAGEVDMRHNGGIRQREIDQGWILPCCSRPLADVTLER